MLDSKIGRNTYGSDFSSSASHIGVIVITWLKPLRFAAKHFAYSEVNDRTEVGNSAILAGGVTALHTVYSRTRKTAAFSEAVCPDVNFCN